MRIGKKKAKVTGGDTYCKPAKNESKKTVFVLLVVLITAILILWVFTMSRQAQDTIRVCIVAQDVYKNEVITEDMLKPYDMIRAEYEKYAITDNNGNAVRKIILWNEKDKIINSFAAYPIQAGNYAEYRSFIKSRVSNTDNVLYSYPGKEMVPLEISSNELTAFKTFLEPGDSLNVEAVFSEEFIDTATGARTQIYKTETVFKDIMLADLLNNDGRSILDIYSQYKEATVYQQANMDNDETFKKSTEPKALLVALTPEEKDRYYYYTSKSDVKFKVSLPQRAN